MNRLFFSTLAVVIGLGAGLVLTGRLHSSQAGDAAVVAPADAAGQAGQAAPQSGPAGRTVAGLPDFTGVAGQAVSAVTKISSTQAVRTANSPFFNDPFFRYFFGDETETFGGGEIRDVPLGSGVVVTPTSSLERTRATVATTRRQAAAAPSTTRSRRRGDRSSTIGDG